ncbi:2-C-methyl-D-erythritol 4-phosphate cytidylyltransferase [Candidatus Berkiella aquae]|uniref:2-C-methyl-D-erythritol 4-phosphate cytidylyltransferase n=1 Tax=Candidatus Berkiella aquae TaxID=295108 RepID=A0A0Q9YKC1_9GAMM|nr:2-C-methyl-D-erythritol 4-phosphate cytidylyltransferase [Candidatus Berkiella aquae]MCS5711191.1 2-C-methyl-D-erythritol 4-phosphate cytidylyltransferase [Candidatus Berkiella aquae]
MQQISQGYWIVIPAAGFGSRFGQEKPKQYWSLHGKTILEHTLNLFVEQPWVKQIIVAVAESDPYFKQLSLTHHKIKWVVGGETRSQSVMNALTYLPLSAQNDWVLVHDAARACLDERDLYALLELRDDTVGGILASPAADTLKKVDGKNQIVQTINRNEIWLAQTPQMFRVHLLKKALEKAKASDYTITDEASAIEYLGYTPCVVEAQFPNPKLTYAADLKYVEFLLSGKLMEDVLL